MCGFFINKEDDTMKKRPYLLISTITLVMICLLVIPAIKAEQADGLEVIRGAICRDVVDREPVDAGTQFAPSVGKLYCFTQITGAQGPTEVFHVWYFAETERARVSLSVNGSSWRTYSSKIIQSHEIGGWRVDVLDPEGKVLETLLFEIKP
jgi:hypothetical protein